MDKNTNEKIGALTIQRYGDRFFALYEGQDLVCVTVYKKGALEVKRRLENSVLGMIQDARDNDKI